MTERISNWLCAALLAVVVFAIWLPWMFKPLTLDETATYWVISDGVAQILPKCLVFTQSILYDIVVWAATKLIGTSAFALRLPSFLASVGTLWLLAKLGARAIGPQYRLLIPVLWLFFLDSPTFSVQARPYGIGMCLGAWALVALDAFLAEGSARRLWIFAFIVPLSTYFSFVFGLSVAAFGLFLLLQTFWYRRVSLAQCFGIFALWIVMALPLVPQILANGKQAAIHTIPNAIRNRDDLFLALMPIAIVFGVVAALLITLIRKEEASGSQTRNALLLCAVLVALVSIVPLYVVTQKTPAKLWAGRYMSIAYPSMALLYTAILARWAGPSGRIAAVALPAMLLFTPSITTAVPRGGSFPEVVATIDKEHRDTGGQVYVMSQFAEGWRWPYPTADTDKAWLLAPFGYYKLAEPYDILPNAIEQAIPAEQEKLIAKLQAEGAMVIAGTRVPDWLQTALTPNHSIRFAFYSDSYFIAVVDRR